VNHSPARPGRLARWRLIAVSVALLVAGCGSQPPGAGTPPRTARTSPPAQAATVARPAVSPFAGLGRYLARRAGRITAALYDARTGRTWLLHPAVSQYTASIVKVEIMGTALREAQSAGGGLPAAEAGLLPPMIENSDNDAATTLLGDVGGAEAVTRFDQSAGMRHTRFSTLPLIPGTPWPGWGLTTTTALDQVALLRRFAFPNRDLSDRSRSYGLALMEHVEAGQNWGVSAGTGAGTTVALKNGWLPLSGAGWQVNSIGWISGRGRDYVLAVLTDHDPSEAYGIATIACIATIIFGRERTAGR
jgi:beta-lactamase class A